MTVFWIGAFVAVLALGSTPSMAFVPTVSQQVQIGLDYQAMEWFGQTPVAYQYKAANSLRYAVTGKGLYPWGFGLSYDNFDSAGQDGKAWTAVVGYRSQRNAFEEALDNLAWGIKVIEEYWDSDDFDSVLYEGVAPYVSYKYEDWTFGGYVLAGYTFSDEPQVGEEFFYGIGVAGAYRLQIADAWRLVPRLGVQYYDSGQNGWEESLSITADIGVKFDVSEKVTLGAFVDYTVETADMVDDSWYGFGLKISGQLSDNIRGYAGVKTTRGFDGPGNADFDDITVRAGLHLQF